MLKALELAGFKSFADKTRFEFSKGITVIVGPNGSGKSNVVDAIKWVLGEQSAKSLRGKDMADVIFKGSGTSSAGRRAANSAEATLVIDNSDDRFAIDSDEIRVTRRVYRSGEGEYLINDEPGRLKDIRNLFRGTGIGTDAYSLIEQGKLDRVLQASAKDRRAIFEEAAGISRFKAKKIEAQRRLARVENNLIRLADIVEEVGSRYRSVKAQASKAARYKEYTERLKQLRTEVGLTDYRRIAGQLKVYKDQNELVDKQLADFSVEIEKYDSTIEQSDSVFHDLGEAIAKFESAVSDSRALISEIETKATYEADRGIELEKQSANVADQLKNARQRYEEIKTRLVRSQAELTKLEGSYYDDRESLTKVDHEYQATSEKLTLALTQVEEKESSHKEQETLLNRLNLDIGNLKSEQKGVAETIAKHQEKSQSLTLDIQQQKQDVALLQEELKKQESVADSNDSALAEAREKLTLARNQYEESQREFGQLKAEQSGAAQRADVIEELEKKLEGLQAGVKQVLSMANENIDTPFGEVAGMVADLVQVNVEHAPLIDVILGEVAQYVVVSGNLLNDALRTREVHLLGRIGFLQLDDLPPKSAGHGVDLSGLKGVIGRADQLTTSGPRFKDLVERILGNTWLVKTIDDAFRLRKEKSNAVRYITLDGELIEPDGRIVVGPRTNSIGLVSRRSELRALRIRVHELDDRLETLQQESKKHKSDIEKYSFESEQMLKKQSELSRQLADQRLMANTASDKLNQQQLQLTEAQTELETAQQRHSQLKLGLSEQQSSLSGVSALIAELLAFITSRRNEVGSLSKSQKEAESKRNQLQLDLAKREQQLDLLQQTVRELETDSQERSVRIEQLETERKELVEKTEQSTRGRLDATSQIAEFYLKKEASEKELIENRLQLNRLTRDREVAIKASRKIKDSISKLQSQKHDLELESSKIQHQQETMAERIRDDYGIDLAEMEEVSSDPELEEKRLEVEKEIDDLRRKINNIGAVNTDALAELEQLESRYTSMESQYQDLVKAKETLDRIIVRINADSRRLFSETLEAIRINFQTLYRQTFGGGKADIRLEEGVDVLEAGIEIVATPPGKPEFSNSLLSGGEKALTAVSLILSIFQFRPSPFCVLDEVDAPFDEANVGRFIDVLKSFLGWTRFIIVTHSKKTMTAADTLYGVTMQESGVSTKVAVRFEDVSEDGHISQDAINRQSDDDEAA